MSVRRAARLVAAAALAAAATVAAPAVPASAATCDSDTGVSVVVDFTSLGGGIAATCVADGGGDSAGTILEVHHDLTRVQQFPGAVCKVDGTPADAQCQTMPPTNAYWGLFWSDGSGGWVYSSEGVDSLDIPEGGSVGFAWQDGGDRDQPGIAPPQAEDEPSSSPSPSGGSSGGSSGGDGQNGGSSGTSGGTGGTGGSSSSPSGSPSDSQTASPTGTPSAAETDGAKDGTGEKGDRSDEDQGGRKGDGKKGDRGRAEPDETEGTDAASPTDDPSDAVPASAEPPAGSDDGDLPRWVAPAAIAGLFGVAGVIALIRRRSAA